MRVRAKETVFCHGRRYYEGQVFVLKDRTRVTREGKRVPLPAAEQFSKRSMELVSVDVKPPAEEAAAPAPEEETPTGDTELI